MAYTLLESAAQSKDQLERGVTKLIVEACPILEKLRFQTIEGNSLRYKVEVTLPGIAFRGINDSYPASTGSTQEYVERVVIMGGEVKIDVAQLRMQSNVVDLKAEAYAAKARAIGLAFSEIFFEGDSTSNLLVFDGMRRRIAGNQLYTPNANGGALTVDYLDYAIDLLLGMGEDAEMFMNKILRRKVTNLGRNTGGYFPLITSESDSAFGHQVKQYNGVPIRVIEREDNENTYLDFDETCGSSNVTASIYFLRFGERYVSGLKGAGGSMEVKDFGELESAPQVMGRVEWYPGLLVKHPRSFSRIKGITNA